MHLVLPNMDPLIALLFVLCSTFAGQRAPGAEPPQSAQDKARMDKEYLSLMAELGEAPIPTSGGGTQAGAPRASGPNQPPPVSLKPKCFHSCRRSSKLTSGCVCCAEPTSLDELWTYREQELPGHAWRTHRPWRTSQLSSPYAQHEWTTYAS